MRLAERAAAIEADARADHVEAVVGAEEGTGAVGQADVASGEMLGQRRL